MLIGSRFNRPVIYDYIYQIANGIEELHRFGIVHRDLKPANILMDREGNRDVLKITDFGLAKLLNNQRSGRYYPRVYGTALYMAPEQEDGEPCTKAVDNWAIGIIFYELAIAPDVFMDQERYSIIDNHRDSLPDRFPEEVIIFNDLNNFIKLLSLGWRLARQDDRTLSESKDEPTQYQSNRQKKEE